MHACLALEGVQAVARGLAEATPTAGMHGCQVDSFPQLRPRSSPVPSTALPPPPTHPRPALQTDPYHRISSELSEEVLTSFLEVHPVLQHYEFLKGQPNGNGVFGVRRVEGEVVVGSMWGGDA